MTDLRETRAATSVSAEEARKIITSAIVGERGPAMHRIHVENLRTLLRTRIYRFNTAVEASGGGGLFRERPAHLPFRPA